MTAGEGRGERRGNGRQSILVAIQIDSHGGDLIKWAIRNAAEAGDRVIAVHVHRKSDPRSQSVLSLSKSLDSFLSEFDAGEVVLVGKLSRGSSIKKTIVKEADICGATTVIVGVNKNLAFRGPDSLSRYCARKLPSSASLLAVHDGMVAYERKATKPATKTQERATRTDLGSMLHPSLSMRSEGSMSLGYQAENRSESRGSPTDKGTAGVENVGSVIPKCRCRRSLSSIVEKLPEKPSGWPLQRAASMDMTDARGGEEARNLSVVQWAMNLPDRPQSQQSQLCKKLKMMVEENASNCRWFRRNELEASTHDFSPDNLIGNGGCSRVFRGCLSDGMEIAVKKMKLTEEALRDFIQEVEIVTSLQHDHVVQLIGVCIDECEMLSVYNFFPRGSLEENLHSGKKVKKPLPWSVRYKIALGIAEALNYLHVSCPRRVIHRDIKSSNILLSNNFQPQLADFGLAVWAPTSTSITCNDVVGTFGYLAPEYFMYGKVSNKVDVYSFGVVLLELLTGRRPISLENSEGQESLVMWVTKVLEEGELMDSLDPSIQSDCNEDQIQRMMMAASISITRVARFRPKMNQVLALLKGEETIDDWIKPGRNCFSKEEEAAKDKENHDYNDDETYPPSTVASYLEVALQDIDDTTSTSSSEQARNNLEDYLLGRCSRSSSFD